MFNLYSDVSGVVGSVSVILAGVAVMVGVRRKRRPASANDPVDGLVTGDF
jgi:hypothetical protein